MNVAAFCCTMSNLKQIQQAFLNAVTDDDITAITPIIKSTNSLNAQQRVNVYKNNIHGGLGYYLREAYPVCLKLVGEEFFNTMAAIYIDQHPSHSPSLNFYGDKFAEFIRNFPPAAELPYLPDVASLEWAQLAAAIAAEDNSNNDNESISSLAQLDAEQQNQAILLLSRSATLLHSNYPILKIWQVNQDDYPDEPIVDLDEDGDYLIIWRNQQRIDIDKVTKLQWLVLAAIAKERTLAELCQQFAGAQHSIIAVLSELTAAGWVVGFK